jgi:hypothetical protein
MSYSCVDEKTNPPVFIELSLSTVAKSQHEQAAYYRYAAKA